MYYMKSALQSHCSDNVHFPRNKMNMAHENENMGQLLPLVKQTISVGPHRPKEQKYSIF